MNVQKFYRDFLVEESHLNTLQADAEDADAARVVDLLGTGVAFGLELQEQLPVPDLRLTLRAGTAYDARGRRVVLPADVALELAVDGTGAPTGVAAGDERYVAVYVRYARALTQPYSDPVGGDGFFRQLEGADVLVVAGAAAAAGTARPPAPPTEDPVLVGRVLRRAGQTQLTTLDVDLTDVPRVARAADLRSSAVERRLECLPTEPPSLSVRVLRGRVHIDGRPVDVPFQLSPALVPPPAEPRIDLIYVDAAGVVGVREGVAGPFPLRPDARGVLPVAYVPLAAGHTAVRADMIEDGRPWLQAQTGVARVLRFQALGGEQRIALPFAYTQGVHGLEVRVDGLSLDEDQYSEVDATALELAAPLAAGQVLVVRALDVVSLGVATAHAETHAAGGADPLAGLALAQLGDDLSGLLVGGASVAFDPVDGRYFVSDVALAVIGQRRLAGTGLRLVAGPRPADTWHYLYLEAAGASGLRLVLSLEPPDDARVWERGARTRRYLAASRTDARGVPYPFRKVGTAYTYRPGPAGFGLAAFYALGVPTGGNAGAWTDVSLTRWLPPHAFLARVTMVYASRSGTLSAAQLRSKGDPLVGAEVQAQATVFGDMRARPVAIETDAFQTIQYQITHSDSALTLTVDGWEEG